MVSHGRVREPKTARTRTPVGETNVAVRAMKTAASTGITSRMARQLSAPVDVAAAGSSTNASGITQNSRNNTAR